MVMKTLLVGLMLSLLISHPALSNSSCQENENHQVTTSLLTDEEELKILLHMKEEEKLARDVYNALNVKWNVPVFTNIPRSENVHMSAVINLLKAYGEEYTLEGEPGKFNDPLFQKLYEQLVSEGSKSLADAYKTGALIEDMDIKDLEEFIEKAPNESTKMVFMNLLKGSRNHMRAFNRNLVKLGINYTPEFISQEQFNKIISSPHETGNAFVKEVNTGQNKN